MLQKYTNKAVYNEENENPFLDIYGLYFIPRCSYLPFNQKSNCHFLIALNTKNYFMTKTCKYKVDVRTLIYVFIFLRFYQRFCHLIRFFPLGETVVCW